jgi:hypothetical protein
VKESKGEEVCEWGESVVTVEESEGRIEDVKIMKSSKGGMKIKGGEITIIKGEFENNNPKFKEFPSFRRNLLCEGRGKIEIESLKGGDGHQNRTSLFILSSDDCILKGIPIQRLSPLFIPSISNVKYQEDKNDKINYILIFTGSLFFPCIFNFKLRGESNIEEKANTESTHPFTNIPNEERGEGRIERGIIESITWDIEMSVFINFPSFSSSSFASSLPFILINRSSPSPPPSPSDDKKTESGVEEESGGNALLILLVVVLSLGLIGSLVGLTIYFFRHRKLKRRIEEGEREESERLLKRRGVEMEEKKAEYDKRFPF